MKGGIIILLNAIKEQEILAKEIKELKREIRKCPKGTLICTKNGKYVKNYQSIKGKAKYIPKKKRELLENLVMKRYWLSKLKDMLFEQKVLNKYIEQHKKHDSEVEKLMSRPTYRKVMEPIIAEKSIHYSDWMDAEYEKNQAYPEKLKHDSVTGEKVRSKSEGAIIQALVNHKIPFHYEEALVLGDITIYPDFTIRHPRTGEVWYWEHFGLMDDPDYIEKTGEKIKLYALNGIVPSVNLITTYETLDHPLSPISIDEEIKKYLL